MQWYRFVIPVRWEAEGEELMASLNCIQDPIQINNSNKSIKYLQINVD